MSDAPRPDNVTPLPPRRTYLDAARQQGVHHQGEEDRAELWERKAELQAKRIEAEREGHAAAAPKLSVVHSEKAKPMTREEASMARVDAILTAYAGAGLGDAHFPLLRHLIMTPSFKAENVDGLFEATLGDCRRSAVPQALNDATLHERRRLGLDQGGL